MRGLMSPIIAYAPLPRNIVLCTQLISFLVMLFNFITKLNDNSMFKVKI